MSDIETGEPVPVERHSGEVRSYADGWSNHYPTTDGTVEREASIELAHIAPWCVPGHQDSVSDTEIGPWLRLDINTSEHNFHNPTEILNDIHASVILDQDAAIALRDALGRWLDIPKVHPTAPTPVTS